MITCQGMHRTCVIAILLVSVCALWGSSHAIPHRPRSPIGPRDPSGIPLDRTDDAGRWVYTPSDKHQRNNLVPPRITDEEYRLPTHLRPTVYTIHLTPFIEPDNFTIRGSTEIFFDCISSTNNITMNAIELTIDLLSIAVNYHFPRSSTLLNFRLHVCYISAGLGCPSK